MDDEREQRMIYAHQEGRKQYWKLQAEVEQEMNMFPADYERESFAAGFLGEAGRQFRKARA